MGRPHWDVGYISNRDKGTDLSWVFFWTYQTVYKLVPSLVRHKKCSCRIGSFEVVPLSCILQIGSWPQGNMYLQYRSSCALIETKASICLCMLRKGVNLFDSLSKITSRGSLCMPGAHEGNAICGMSPKLASVLLFSPLMAFKTVHCRSRNSLLGKREWLIGGDG